jgi:hypothetical protein
MSLLLLLSLSQPQIQLVRHLLTPYLPYLPASLRNTIFINALHNASNPQKRALELGMFRFAFAATPATNPVQQPLRLDAAAQERQQDLFEDGDVVDRGIREQRVSEREG